MLHSDGKSVHIGKCKNCGEQVRHHAGYMTVHTDRVGNQTAYCNMQDPTDNRVAELDPESVTYTTNG